MKIYFAGSITGGRSDAEIYQFIIKELRSWGEVLTEHVADKDLLSSGEDEIPETVRSRDLGWLRESDVLVGEVSVPSLGVGYEIAKAEEWGKRVLLLHRPVRNRISPMLSGSPKIQWQEYKNQQEIQSIIKDFFLESSPSG